MPDFPRYQSKGQITTQQPSVQAPEDTTGKVIQTIGEAGKVVQDASLKWMNAVDTIQKTAAQANFKSGVLDITSRAQNDPDYNNSEQYFKEIEKLKTDSIKGFQSKTAETEAAIEFGYEAKVAQIQIGNLYKKKMIDVGQASMLRLLDMEASAPTEDFQNRIIKILGTQADAGIISREDAYKLEKEYLKKGKYNSFLSDLSVSPAITEAKLSKNEYDFDITELEKARSIFDSESKKIQAVNENEVLTAYLNGNPYAPEEIKQLMNDKKVDAKFAESMISKLNNYKPDPVSQDRAYIDLQDKELTLLDKEDELTPGDIAGHIAEVVQAHAQGLLDKADVQRVTKEWGAKLSGQLGEKAMDVLEKTRPKNFFEKISFWSDEYGYKEKQPEIKARMYRNLIDGIIQGKDPETVLSKIINDEVSRMLADDIKKPTRRYAVDTNTKRRIYSDDGGNAWFDEKTGSEVK